jgi:aspartyl-tRNA(Asn)/glutamyl-tRNA(Gln) amidotransferase subunit B
MSLDAVDAERFTALVRLIKDSTITDKSGVEVLRVMLDQRMKNEQDETPSRIVARLNLAKTAGDAGELTAVITEVIAQNSKAVEDYRNGKNGALNFLVGQAMKKTRGRSDPGELNRLVIGMLGTKEA